MIRKLKKAVIYFLFVSLATLFLMELSFRYQIIDFYRFEFTSLNPAQKTNKNPVVLVFGDSFSTYPNGYIDQLRKLNPDIQFVNSAISGTGIKQHALLFNKRIKENKPDAIIYQFYVGNDFLDLEHPTNYETLSIGRNLYWELSEHFLILQYLNFKLAGLKVSTNSKRFAELQDDRFDLNLYNGRVKLNFQADPEHLSNDLLLKDERKSIYSLWKNYFNELMELRSDSIPVYLLLVPHCAQVHPRYFNNMEQVGAKLDEDLVSNETPLYQRMKNDFSTIEIWDPLPYFKKLESEGKHLYFGNDPHLNPQGQKALGQFIQEQLMNEN